MFATNDSTSVFAGLGPSISTATMNAKFKDTFKSTEGICSIMVLEWLVYLIKKEGFGIH